MLDTDDENGQFVGKWDSGMMLVSDSLGNFSDWFSSENGQSVGMCARV